MKARTTGAPDRIPSHPDPDIAIALDRMYAEEEDRDRTILGLHWPRRVRSSKRGRGRPSTLDSDNPTEIIATLQGTVYEHLSDNLKCLADRLGREIPPKGRPERIKALIVEAVLTAHKAGAVLSETPGEGRTSAYEVAANQYNKEVGAVAAIYKRWRREYLKAPKFRF